MTRCGSKKIAVVTGSNKEISGAIVLAFARSTEYKGIVTNSRKIEEAQEDYVRTNFDLK